MKIPNSYDNKVLKLLLELKRNGRTFVRAGEIARKTRSDSVKALGAMLRVKSAAAGKGSAGTLDVSLADHVYSVSEKEPDQHAEAIEAIELQEYLDERNQ